MFKVDILLIVLISFNLLVFFEILFLIYFRSQNFVLSLPLLNLHILLFYYLLQLKVILINLFRSFVPRLRFAFIACWIHIYTNTLNLSLKPEFKLISHQLGSFLLYFLEGLNFLSLLFLTFETLLLLASQHLRKTLNLLHSFFIGLLQVVNLDLICLLQLNKFLVF